MNKQILFWCFLLISITPQIFSIESEGSKVDSSFPQGFYDNCNGRIDPQTAILLNKINLSPPAFRKLPIDELKQISGSQSKELTQHSNIEKIENIEIAGPNGPLTLRIYTPKSTSPVLPVFVFLHGGGWTVGSLNEYDDFCQEICSQSGSLLVAVEYGLAPKYTFPQPLEDCTFAVKWIKEHIKEKGGDPKRIAIGGDSAGANLTAAATLKAREEHYSNFLCQILICPALNYNFETLSYYEFAEGYFLSKEDLKFFWNNYLDHNPALGKNPYASPLRAESLANLPPAYLIIANFDPMRDEGLAYGLRLYREGVPTTIKRFNSIHGFYDIKELNLSSEAISYISTQLRNEFERAGNK